MPVRENPSIELFNKARKHAFSVLNKYEDYEKSKFFLRDPRYTKLSPASKSGLLAELLFYFKYKKDLRLTPALDCGDKTDFIGEIENHLSRIDVTTNLRYKKSKDYQDFIQDDWAFWLVNVDIKSDPIEPPITFIPLHFPSCDVCNKASIFNLVYLKQDLHSTYIDHFTIMILCPYCLTFERGPKYEWDIQSFFSNTEVPHKLMYKVFFFKLKVACVRTSAILPRLKNTIGSEMNHVLSARTCWSEGRCL